MMARNPLQSSTPLSATTPLPSWWDNPIGTQRDDRTYVTATRPEEGFDPVVGYWPTGKPMTRGEYDGMRNASLALFDQVSMVGGGRVANPLTALPKGRLRTGKLDKSLHLGAYPPDKPQRAIEDDYLKGVPLDDTGRIARTIEGVPLTAQNVAGRRSMDSFGNFPDRGLDQSAIKSIAEEVSGRPLLGMPGAQFSGKTVGTYDPRTRQIAYRNSLGPDGTNIVVSHEVGHMIDDVAGTISPKRLDGELKWLYNTLFSGQERKTHLTGPKDLGYKPHEVPGEFMAEAVRAYMQNPNFMKAMAPKTATAIRKAVNEHPDLSKWIQFNALFPVAVTAANEQEGR